MHCQDANFMITPHGSCVCVCYMNDVDLNLHQCTNPIERVCEVMLVKLNHYEIYYEELVLNPFVSRVRQKVIGNSIIYTACAKKVKNGRFVIVFI